MFFFTHDCLLLFFIFSFSPFKSANSDLPIHALLSDVIGTWIFTLTQKESNEPLSCGGGVPNLNLENLNKRDDSSKKGDKGTTIKVVLTDIKTKKYKQPTRKKWSYLVVNLPFSKKQIGSWTMVYDEGFEVRIGNKTFFGLFKYDKAGGDDCKRRTNGDAEDIYGNTKCYATDPSSIQIGWTYTEEKNKNNDVSYKWGCFEAEKENKKIKNNFFVAAGGAFGLPDVPLPHKNNQFKNESPENLRKYKKHFGYQKIHFDYSLPSFSQINKKGGERFACELEETEEEAAPLPAQWTWGDPFLTEDYNAADDPVTNQRNCGSCYAVSGVYVLQKRFEILINKLFPFIKNKKIFLSPLSAQTILSCSPFNQGCDGGFPFLVGKHAKEIGVATELCQTYAGEDESCPLSVGNFFRSPKYSKEHCGVDDRWFAKDYNYVGGFYEGCDEEKIKTEIYHHGPVVAAIDAPDDLFIYDDGVFISHPAGHGKFCDLPNKGVTGWEYTNHAIAIVGWGEDPPRMPGMPHQKFWVVRNTWGNQWGRNGYMKIKRGDNLAAIESQAVAIDPDVSRGQAAVLINKLKNK